ncbi:ABC transporter ATP-binding protein [Breznakiella homolactica]|uniref:ABC transporter ATP-binding protein n=1 Tax=Breznakiella homolactica TaxID=2798577 RepID=A0A7T7XMQ5_9SPIR|nr:ABC transporter ATP-binding protein [Breznakiella homolactica]QQO09195.1 ABC transporter ATP-binding protein [Breznakiella homolactica]
MAFIELQGIDAGYEKGKPILKDFNLTVEQGELVSLLGPSGCGKTTTLRTIAGFIMAEKGKVFVGGKDYSNLPPNKRNIGLVFQTYALFPHLSVFDNVAYGLRRRHVPKNEIKERVMDILKLVSLTGFEDRVPANLSGGQRQRVALARSIVIRPELLLLDEPLSNLDAKLRDEMRAELSRLQHQLGITMIYVTHDQIEAMSLSSRIIVMNLGKIEQSGTPEEIYEYPATPFVARFVGFDNKLDGTLVKLTDQQAAIDVNGTEFISRRPSPHIDQSDVGKKVSLFFRPDDTQVNEKPGQNALEASIDFSNYQGNTTQYALHTGDYSLRAVVQGKPLAEGADRTVFSIVPEKLIVEREI